MNATIDVPDDLYRQLEAKSASEGRALKDVAIDLIRRYVGRAVLSELDELRLIHDAQRMASTALTRVWDNPEDAEYDRL